MSNKVSLVMAGALITASPAWAGSQIEDTTSACTGINCGAMALRGVVQTNEPFVIQVFAAEGECLRLDIDSQTQDLTMLVAFPSVNFGSISDDRDFEGGDYRPLIQLDPLPWTGWYTVAVSYWDLANTSGKFILKYGRYPTGNPNCVGSVVPTAQQLKLQGGNPSKVAAPAARATE